ncbi:MAG TPA: GlsB/YeaQ/YmgE family stress response membrane protein [Dokdonella sp.]|uniref:GlsB/YeaQ/YmgE family stress response membrane protein n=1 Tax=Dokdonella sp. TaxID=2291710 RepID=UPI002C169DBC|nr:GlsB/YeaQ/YmgE family stress response membrane protein [Dokdonella sp.]HUD43713.1 GlsB/YeaQ/YmgE family stress response membrane protein [Dokdonella sp.]
MSPVASGDAGKGDHNVAIETVLVWLIVGAVAGWLAGIIVKGHGFGLLGNIVVGIVGAFLAGWLLPQVGLAIGGGIVAAIINALIGAVILLVIIGLIKRA